MERSRSARRAALGALLVLATAACAAGQASSDPFVGGARNVPVLLTVDNQDFRDATIYAIWTGPKERIGTVTGKTTETFSMTWKDYEVYLEVDFLGGGGMRTDRISASPGEHIDFVIQAGW